MALLGMFVHSYEDLIVRELKGKWMFAEDSWKELGKNFGNIGCDAENSTKMEVTKAFEADKKMKESKLKQVKQKRSLVYVDDIFITGSSSDFCHYID